MAEVLDREARFQRLCAAYTPDVLAYALRRTSREDAADAVAETFLVAWRRLDELDDHHVLPWLYAVARRVLMSQRRSSQRQRAIAERVAATESSALPPSPEPFAASSRLREGLTSLSEKDREALMLAAWEELPSREAARVLGCSATAYRIRLHRARTRLREKLGDSDTGSFRSSPPSARTEESPSC